MTTYCDVSDVRRILQQEKIFTSETQPSKEEIKDTIEAVEDFIDNKTGHSWRTRYSKTRSGRSTVTSSADYEYYDIPVRMPYNYRDRKSVV